TRPANRRGGAPARPWRSPHHSQRTRCARGHHLPHTGPRPEGDNGVNPRSLPRLRDGLVRHLTNPDAAVRTETGADNWTALDTLARNAQEAGLFWVSEDMAALAVSAGRQLDDACWSVEARP